MKITYRGGYNKRDPNSVQKSILIEYSRKALNNLDSEKKLAVVTYAKDDGYFDEQISKYFGIRADIIGHMTPTPEWGIYDVIFLLGGDQNRLKKALLNSSFSLSILKKSAHMEGTP